MDGWMHSKERWMCELHVQPVLPTRWWFWEHENQQHGGETNVAWQHDWQRQQQQQQQQQQKKETRCMNWHANGRFASLKRTYTHAHTGIPGAHALSLVRSPGVWMLLSSQVFSAVHSVLASWSSLKKPEAQTSHLPIAAATNFLPAAHLVTDDAGNNGCMCL